MDIINFRVAPDSESLELWVEVPEGPKYDEVFIKRIAIIDHTRYTSDTSYPDTPFKIEFTYDNPVEWHKIPEEKDGDFEGMTKMFIKRIPFTNPHFQIKSVKRTGMYYVYIETNIPVYEDDEVKKFDIPCCCFKELTIACTINHYPVYNQMLKIIYAYEDRCLVAEDKLLDLYLRKLMITQAVELSDYVNANKIYNDIYKREIERSGCLDACSYLGTVNTVKNNKCVSCG